MPFHLARGGDEEAGDKTDYNRYRERDDPVGTKYASTRMSTATATHIAKMAAAIPATTIAKNPRPSPPSMVSLPFEESFTAADKIPRHSALLLLGGELSHFREFLGSTSCGTDRR